MASFLLLYVLCTLLIFQEPSFIRLQTKAVAVQVQNRQQSPLQMQFGSNVSDENNTYGSNFEDSQNSLKIGTNETKQYLSELPRWAQLGISVTAVLVGIFQLFYGYKFFKLSVFVVIGTISGFIMFDILASSIADDVNNKVALSYGIAVVVGVVVGSFFVWALKAAVFGMGACVGVLVAIYLDPIVLVDIWPQQPQLNLYIWMAVFGLVFGLFVLCLEKFLMILSTALAGSFLIVFGSGEIIGNLPNLKTDVPLKEINETTWIYLGTWAGLFLIGLLIQVFITAKDSDHREYQEVRFDYMRL